MSKCDTCGEEEVFECASCEQDKHVAAVVAAAQSEDWLARSLAQKYIKDMLSPRPWEKPGKGKIVRWQT